MNCTKCGKPVPEPLSQHYENLGGCPEADDYFAEFRELVPREFDIEREGDES